MPNDASDLNVKKNVKLLDARVLIVDDNASDRLLIKTILIKLGIQNLQEAENVNAAAFKIQNAIGVGKKFDLIILDWNMPGKSGFELLKEIRTQKETNDTSVIMVTSVSETEKIRDSLRMGIEDFILKPLKHEHLAAKVEKVLLDSKKK